MVAEIDEFFANNSEDEITFDSLSELNYVDCVRFLVSSPPLRFFAHRPSRATIALTRPHVTSATQVIKETLRLEPSIPLSARVTTKDIQLGE